MKYLVLTEAEAVKNDLNSESVVSLGTLLLFLKWPVILTQE